MSMGWSLQDLDAQKGTWRSTYNVQGADFSPRMDNRVLKMEPSIAGWAFILCTCKLYCTLISMQWHTGRGKELPQGSHNESSHHHGMPTQACGSYFKIWVGLHQNLPPCVWKGVSEITWIVEALLKFLAVQNSSIGDLVTHSLTNSLTH